MAENTTQNLDLMRSQWTELYSKTLPALARARDAAQPKWPVTLDHCFARIILDNTVGRGMLQWDNVIKKPAVRNMDAAQLKEAIEVGERIKNGEVDLVALDQQSLRARGKGEKKYKGLQLQNEQKLDGGSASKRVREGDDEDTAAAEKEVKSVSKRPRKQANGNSSNSSSKQATLAFSKQDPNQAIKQSTPPTNNLSSLHHPTISPTNLHPNPDTPHLLHQITTHPTLTPFRKRLYSTLLSVPAGHYTTYASMATYLNSAARAVGSGMRNNPFAPGVPCHRVLAADGSIGGFCGDWGAEGKYANEKRELLGKEGVRFDSRGKVKGPIYVGLRDMRELV